MGAAIKVLSRVHSSSPPGTRSDTTGPCVGDERPLLTEGALPRGSPNCWSHRKSPRGARSGVHPGHLQGDMERVGRLSVNGRVPRESGPKLPPFGGAGPAARLGRGDGANGPEAGPTPILPPLPTRAPTGGTDKMSRTLPLGLSGPSLSLQRHGAGADRLRRTSRASLSLDRGRTKAGKAS